MHNPNKGTQVGAIKGVAEELIGSWIESEPRLNMFVFYKLERIWKRKGKLENYTFSKKSMVITIEQVIYAK